MAQGKLKVKSKKPALSNRKTNKASQKSGKVAKRGRMVIAPKKASQQQIHKIQKSITKNINKSIEQQIAQRAHQLEEGKAFNVVQNPSSSKSKSKSKK